MISATWSYLTFKGTKGVNPQSMFRINFPSNKPITSYDPAHIQLAPDYILCENLFSTLVEFDPNGRLVGGIAEKFEWQGNNLVFKIRNHLKTIGGKKISAKDVVFSFKRLLILDSTTHGNLKSLLCQNQKIQSIEDHCPGIIERQDEVIFTLDRHKTFLIPLLASIDFAIIPQSSVDPKTLKIINYKETSGPYYVSATSAQGFKLLPNLSHYHYSKKMPQNVEFVFSESIESSWKKITEGTVDLLTTVDHVPSSEMIAFAASNKEFNLHHTMNIRSLVTTFTKLGINSLSEEQRLNIGRIIRKSFTEYLHHKEGFEIQSQIFPVFGAAGLPTDQVNSLTELLNRNINPEISVPLRMRVVRLEPFEEFRKVLIKALPQAIIERGTVPSFEKFPNDQQEPHLFISGPDFGYLEDFSLLSYYMGTGYFGLFGKEAQLWIKDYQETSDQNKRLVKLRNLHFYTIARARTMPIASYPYTALVKKPWKLNFSHFFADTQLWLIQHPH